MRDDKHAHACADAYVSVLLLTFVACWSASDLLKPLITHIQHGFLV